MAKPRTRTIRLLSTAATTAALVAAPALSAPAAAADRGLFGSQDPTYDGVYRQGLAIAGLVAVERSVPRASVAWLLRQQCANGAFLSYRANPGTACPKPDPVAFTGPDSNSTAMGAMALRAVGQPKAANRAIRYLRSMQNRDGGFAYYRGGPSDVNSTGLAMTALRGIEQTAAINADLRDGNRYLSTAQLRCEAPTASRGLLSYQATPKLTNWLASAQGALGLATTLPAGKIRVTARSAARLRCVDGRQEGAASVRDTLLDGVTRALVRGKGLLPSSLGSGTDPSATAQAAIALTILGRSPAVTRLSVRALRKAAASYTGARTTPDAGALGTLLLLAGAVDANPRKFGGVNLVTTLSNARQR